MTGLIRLAAGVSAPQWTDHRQRQRRC